MPRRSGAGPPKNLGRAIDNDRRRRAEQLAANPGAGIRAVGVAEGQAHRSVLEQSSLDQFLAEAELAKTSFESTRGEPRPRNEGPRLVSEGGGGRVLTAAAAEAKAAAARQVTVPIPWRPQWKEGMTAEELAFSEGEAFLEWRRGLAKLEEQADVVMTPYERNLDFWRQLWRCVERCSLLVQILDCRDPEFYRCRDLERYVRHFSGKQHLLLLNKADFLSPELRQRWAAHFRAQGVDILFFSALRELHRQQRLPAASAAADPAAAGAEGGEPAAGLPPHGPLQEEAPDVADCARLVEELRARLAAASATAEAGARGGSASSTVGFVGYPNVGKSSVINALFGAKKVSMSRTPGKTKHLQTLELTELGLTLCDCPGLVFPSVVATKAHLVVNGTVPLDELRDTLAPVRLVVGKVGLAAMLDKYSLSAAALRDGATRLGEEATDPVPSLLAALSAARQHFLRLGVPDTNWAARRILRDFCTGELLHCECPEDGSPPAAEAPEPAAAAPAARAPPAPADGDGSESDFSDLDAFLAGEAESSRRPGKRGAAKKPARTKQLR